MSDYVETYTKTTGNTIDSSDFETEFDAIVTAVATKANKISSGTANYVVEQDANGDLVDTGLPTPSSAFVGLTDSQTLTNKILTSPTITGGTITGSVIGSGGIDFEGSSDDGFETTLTVTNPTADRTVTIPDRTGKVGLFYSGTLTTASIANGASENVTVTHNLGTDNVFFSAVGECSAGTTASWVAVMLRVDDKAIAAAGNTSLTGTGAASTPSSGDVVIRVRNNCGTTATVTVTYMIMAGD